MKKLFSLLLLPLLAFTMADWVLVKLDDRVTVNFPVQPEKTKISSDSAWIVDIDKDARCMAFIVDFLKLGADSAMLAAEIVKEEAMTLFKEGVMGQIKGSTLIAEKKGTINGKTYFEYVINMGRNNQSDTLNIMYSRNIFVGDKMYNLSFYEKNNLPRKEDREKFFSSFTLKY